MSNFDFSRAETLLFFIAVAGYFLATMLFVFFFFFKKEKVGKTAAWVYTAAFAVHTLALIVRTIGAGRLPLSNQYEFATSFAWGIALVFLVMLWRHQHLALGAFVSPVIFLVIGYAAMQSRQVNALMPALQSNWLVFHVCTAILGYGAFGVAFGFSFLYLVHGRIKPGSFQDQHLPSLEKLDILSYRAICFGFLFLTLVIITGAIWAQKAWGHYWTWDPKETWSLITWLIYAIYLHQRISRGMQGKKAAWYAFIGFICVLFTYIGVNLFIPSIHSYA